MWMKLGIPAKVGRCIDLLVYSEEEIVVKTINGKWDVKKQRVVK